MNEFLIYTRNNSMVFSQKEAITPWFLGSNLKEAPTPWFSDSNMEEATTPFPFLVLQPWSISVDQLSLPQSLPLSLQLSLRTCHCHWYSTKSYHMHHIPRTPLNYISNITNTCLYQECTNITNIPSQYMCPNQVPTSTMHHPSTYARTCTIMCANHAHQPYTISCITPCVNHAY